jgi:hypothetical protein
MFANNMAIAYPVLVMKSIGKYSFEALGRIAKKSGDTIARLLRPATENYAMAQAIAQELFCRESVVYLTIDDTLLRKVFSQHIEGAGKFFDTKLGKRVMGLKLLVAAVTNGTYTVPLLGSFLFAKELLQNVIQSKDKIIQDMIELVLRLFPDKIVIVVADGAFATKALLQWSLSRKINFQARMHSNRKVLYNGQLIALRDIKSLRPKGRQMARTIAVTWHNMPLFVTAQRRINKHGEESVVFQVATYQAKPAAHVRDYKMRWNIEKINRTGKQDLGLQGCSSRKLETQENHVSSVLLSYSLLQLEMKRRRHKNPEDALRASNRKNVAFLINHFYRILQALPAFYA